MNRNERARLRLRTALYARFRNLSEAAEAIGVGPTYISMLLRGQRVPSLPMAQQIAKALRVPLQTIADATVDTEAA